MKPTTTFVVVRRFSWFLALHLTRALQTVLVLFAVFALLLSSFAAAEEIGPQIRLQAGDITDSGAGFLVFPVFVMRCMSGEIPGGVR